MRSAFLSLNWRDLVKGFIMAIIGGLIAGVYQSISNGTFNFTWHFWQPIVYSAIGSGLAYLLKNLFTNSQDKFLSTEKAVMIESK